MKQKRLFVWLLCGALMITGLAACGDPDGGDEPPTGKEEAFKNAIIPYVDHTVIPTYKGMADNAILMSEACDEIYDAFKAGNLTTDMVKTAGKYWNESRAYWEKSEAWLYGPAADYNIDPHIDSWPLDKVAMDGLLKRLNNGEEWSIDIAGYGLLGFHAVEYMLFELDATGDNSLPHSTNYSEAELIYLCAVAADLRDQCLLLESAWAGYDNITAAKQELLTEAELVVGVNYGSYMKNAGQPGSIYKTYQAAVEDLIQGCVDIADEVGNTKIGRPANGSSTEDKNYIESPYSLNSINDFYDNIISIENAYAGSREGDASVSDYIKSVNAALDAEVLDLIKQSKEAIRAIPEPFAKSATSAEADKAVTLVGTDLRDKLEEVMTELSKY
ncbi:MAG: hypothetical protein IJ442_08770 [Bacteroidaceae bacterium]|nr:hypothetical protein [Bacteroidaceae bacterium]